MKYIIYYVIFIFSIFVSSCSITQSASVEVIETIEKKSNDLDGKKFKLTSIYPNMDITIFFDKKEVYGFGAVNNYISKYEIDGDIFSIEPISRTKIGGSKENMKAENSYIAILQSATSYKLDGNTLIIYTSLSKNTLIFKEIF